MSTPDAQRTVYSVAVAEKFASLLKEHGKNSMLAVFIEMYCRHKRNEPSLDATNLFLGHGKFVHGRMCAIALKNAEKTGYVRRETPEGSKYPLLHPTEKLIALVQGIVDIEAPVWEASQAWGRRRDEAVAAGLTQPSDPH